jgi:hypothetical protein
LTLIAAALLAHAAHDHTPWYRTATFWIVAVTAVLVVSAAVAALRNAPEEDPRRVQQRPVKRRKKR